MKRLKVSKKTGKTPGKERKMPAGKLASDKVHVAFILHKDDHATLKRLAGKESMSLLVRKMIRDAAAKEEGKK